MKKWGLLSVLGTIKLVSAEVFSFSDISKYSTLAYLIGGIAVVLILILLLVIFKRKNLKVRIKSGKIGDEIDITINPGKEGVSNKIMLLSGDTKIGELPICSEQVCYGPKILRYQIPESWKHGKYKLQVHDMKKGWQDFEFEVK